VALKRENILIIRDFLTWRCENLSSLKFVCNGLNDNDIRILFYERVTIKDFISLKELIFQENPLLENSLVLKHLLESHEKSLMLNSERQNKVVPHQNFKLTELSLLKQSTQQVYNHHQQFKPKSFDILFSELEDVSYDSDEGQ